MACPTVRIDRDAQFPVPPRPWFPFRLRFDPDAVGFTAADSHESQGVWSVQWWRLGRGRFCYGEASSTSLWWALRIGMTAWWKVRS
jgi:hypothetical protein